MPLFSSFERGFLFLAYLPPYFLFSLSSICLKLNLTVLPGLASNLTSLWGDTHTHTHTINFHNNPTKGSEPLPFFFCVYVHVCTSTGKQAEIISMYHHAKFFGQILGDRTQVFMSVNALHQWSYHPRFTSIVLNKENITHANYLEIHANK